jgi:hypothetical protein
MDYLKSADDAPGANGRSKLQTYVDKQEKWSHAVEAYSAAQDRAVATFKPPPNPTKEQIKEAKEAYIQWLQEHGRDVSDFAVNVIDCVDIRGNSTSMPFKPDTWIGLCTVTSS